MKKLKENEIMAEFKSIWDGGGVVIISPCIVNTKTRRIRISSKRKIYSEDPDINSENVDDAVNCLDRECVSIHGQEYPACNEESMELRTKNHFLY